MEELDAAVLASLDAILTRKRRCYVTAGELQVATGLSRYYLRRCLLRLTQRAYPLGPDPHVVPSRLRARGRLWAYLRRPLDRNALLACMPRDGWFDLSQVMSFQDTRVERWLRGLVDAGFLEISPPRRPDARPQPIFPGDAITTEEGCTQPLIDASCRARFSDRGQQLASSVASHHPLPGRTLTSVRRQTLVHDLLDQLVRSGPASVSQLRAADHHGAFGSLLEGLVAEGAVEAIWGPDGTRRYRASRFGLYVLAVATEERRLAPPPRRTAQGRPASAIGTIRVTPMLRAVRQIRNGAPAPSWFVPAEVLATAPRFIGRRSRA